MPIPDQARLLHTLEATDNFIIHEYFGIDLELVWSIAQIHIPSLKLAVELILASID